jgi:hypothetical protein
MSTCSSCRDGVWARGQAPQWASQPRSQLCGAARGGGLLIRAASTGDIL